MPIGKPPIVSEYIHEDSREPMLAEWERFVLSNEPVLIMETRWKNGRWSESAIVLADLQFRCMLASLTDLTDSKLARLDHVNGKGGFIGSAVSVQ